MAPHLAFLHELTREKKVRIAHLHATKRDRVKVTHAKRGTNGKMFTVDEAHMNPGGSTGS